MLKVCQLRKAVVKFKSHIVFVINKFKNILYLNVIKSYEEDSLIFLINNYVSFQNKLNISY